MLGSVRENVLFHLVLILSAIFITIKLLDLAIKKEYKDFHPEIRDFYSSIWCNGRDHNDRRCRAKNICYDRSHDEFVFISGPLTVANGLPSNLYDPSLLTLSSLIDHNQFYFNYISISHKYLPNYIGNRNLKWIKDSTILFARFKPDNLMHSFHDDIIPLWWTLLELGINKNFSIFTYDKWPEYDAISFNRIIYERLFKFNRILHKNTHDPGSLVCFHDLSIGLSKETVWYQYGFKEPQGPLNMTIFRQTNIFKAGEMLRKKFKPNPRCNDNSSYGLLLTRSNNRLLLNQMDLTLRITQLNLPMETITIDYDSPSSNILYIIGQILCAKLLIAMHGSGLILSFFLEQNSYLIELFPYGIHPTHYTPYKTLAKHRRLNYRTWTNKKKENSVAHPEYPPHLGGLNHLPTSQKEKIQLLDQDLQPHLCCDDVNWLFRIHQDTFVDVDNLIEQVKLDEIILSTTRSKYDTKQVDNNHLDRDEHFFPGPVKNLLCTHIPANSTYIIAWKNPWNLNYNSLTSKPTFQILIDNRPEPSQSLETSTTHITLQADKDYLIWVRCQLSQSKGPFRYVLCKT